MAAGSADEGGARGGFELIETTGAEAFATWQELRAAGRGYPVVFGSGEEIDAFEELRGSLDAEDAGGVPDFVAETLAAAAELAIPAALIELYDAEFGDDPPPLGKWPEPEPETESGADAEPPRKLVVATDPGSDEPFAKVYIGLFPTDDWTTIPAYLRWGGGFCPSAEYHVATLRRWRDSHGAELVSLSRDTMELRVATRPQTRRQALALAREQYVYCPDLVIQGHQTLRALAGDLLLADWWFFWWD